MNSKWRGPLHQRYATWHKHIECGGKFSVVRVSVTVPLYLPPRKTDGRSRVSSRGPVLTAFDPAKLLAQLGLPSLCLGVEVVVVDGCVSAAPWRRVNPRSVAIPAKGAAHQVQSGRNGPASTHAAA